MKKIAPLFLLIASMPFMLPAFSAQHILSGQEIETIVNGNIKPLMEAENIPGLAVGVIYKGKAQIFSYGIADIKTQRPVTENTLFELGSVSKTFTGLAAGYAIQEESVNLSDPVQKYWSALPANPWKQIKMLNLATYTAGGLPLQLPDSVTDQETLKTYYQTWQPTFKPGDVRAYSNASIGLFGSLAVQKSQLPFDRYLTQKILEPLNLNHTYINVPPEAEKDYAWGYKKDRPVRVMPGMLDAEAYAVKSSVADMVRYLEANMDPAAETHSRALKQAITNAQKRYFLTEDMYQGLGWEMYNWPINPQQIINESNNTVALKPHKTQELNPAQPLSAASWVHKTGSTNGFGAYVAFIPARQVGIVMLANKSYPNPARVKTAYRIINAMLQ